MSSSSTGGVVAYIGLGSNIGDRSANLGAAVRLLETKHDLVRVRNTSFCYETAPQYVTDQPRFLNAVCEIDTDLSPTQLLETVKQIELDVGRQPSDVRHGPRSIDLDILLFGDCRLEVGRDRGGETRYLTVPHPRLHEREFVLRPLHDLAPDLVPHPASGLTTAELLLKQLARRTGGDDECVRVLPLPRNRVLKLSTHETCVMGILNVTPDSFSDGGEHNASVQTAVDHALQMVEDGVDIVDVGGESTRPGADEVSETAEAARVLPVIHALREGGLDIPISIDTRRASVAEAALEAGADLVNDVSAGLFDAAMLPTVKRLGVPMILMHMRGTPQTMQSNTEYSNIVDEVGAALNDRVQEAVKMGIPKWSIVADPGIGFAKTFDQNMVLLRHSDDLIRAIGGVPLLVGASRKAFIGHITGAGPQQRDWGTAAACCAAINGGASIVRVHNIEGIKQACVVADAIKNAKT